MTVNPSYVDFAPPFTIDVSATDEESGKSYTTKGLPKDGLEKICQELNSQADKDGMPWDKLCITDKRGNTIRVLSPNIYRSRTHDPEAFDNYFEPYITATWQHFASTQKSLNFDTQFRGIPNAGLYFPENEVLFGNNVAYQSNVAADMDQTKEYVLLCLHLIYIDAYILSAFWVTLLELVSLTQAAFLMDLKHVRLPLLHMKAFRPRLLG